MFILDIVYKLPSLEKNKILSHKFTKYFSELILLNKIRYHE